MPQHEKGSCVSQRTTLEKDRLFIKYRFYFSFSFRLPECGTRPERHTAVRHLFHNRPSPSLPPPLQPVSRLVRPDGRVHTCFTSLSPVEPPFTTGRGMLSFGCKPLSSNDISQHQTYKNKPFYFFLQKYRTIFITNHSNPKQKATVKREQNKPDFRHARFTPHRFFA